MRKLSFALVGLVTGAGFGSVTVTRKHKSPVKITLSRKDDTIHVSYLDILKVVFQRPSSRLEDLIRLANDNEKAEQVRFEAIRLLALYWRQWSPIRRENAGRALSPDAALSLAVYGRQVNESLFFQPTNFRQNVSFARLEASYVEALKKLSTSSEIRLDPCSMIFIEITLKEVEKLNEGVKRDAKVFKPQFEFFPFDAHVTQEEARGMREINRSSTICLAAKKLELFLTPILKCLENASRQTDHKMAGDICKCLDLYKLLSETVRLENQTDSISDTARRLISSILANLACFQDYEFAASQRRLVVETGFLSLLRFWALHSSSNKIVAYEAIRALKNLDPFFLPKLKSSVGLYYPVWRSALGESYSEDCDKMDVVFIHGVLGGAVYTWRQFGHSAMSPDACWPADWLPFDVNSKLIGKTRFLGVQYHSVLPGFSQCVEPLAFRAHQLMRDLEMSGVGNNGIVWVTHSFGGILLKSMLLQNEKFAENTKAVVFLSTPHLGTPIADQPAKYANILGLASSELEEIKSYSPHLLKLRRAFAKLAKQFNYDVLSVSESSPTVLFGLKQLSRMVVPEVSSLDGGCGRVFRSNDADHLSTCKPTNRNCPIYTTILEIINNSFDITSDHKTMKRDNENN